MSSAPKMDPLIEPHELLSTMGPAFDGPQNAGPPRGNRWLEQYSINPIPTKHSLGAEGSYYIANNATVGTGVAHALLTSFTNTAGLFVIKNNDQTQPSGGGKRIFLDYMKLMATAAPTAGVSLEFLFQLDTTVRTPTANNVAATPVNVNGSVVGNSIALVQAYNAGSLTVPAPSTSTPKNVGRVKMPVGLNVVGDEYIVAFGAVDHAGSSPPLTAIKAAQPARCGATAPPIVIGPQQFLVIYRWSLTEATTAPSYEWELAWWER